MKMEPIDALTRQQIKCLHGQTVCAVLHDGTYYIGTVQGLEDGAIVLHGIRGKGKMPSTSKDLRVNIESFGGFNPFAMGGQGAGKMSGLFGGLPGMQEPQPSAPGMFGGSGSGGLFGGWGKGFKIGLGILSYLWPLFSSRFSI